MRILHTSDWHIGKRLGTFSRIEEQRKVLAEITEIAKAESVDLVLVAGDLFDTYHPPVEAEELLYHTLKELSQEGRVPVIVIAGNHDSPDKIESPHVLAREFGIQLLGYPHTEPPAVALSSGVCLSTKEPGVLAIETPSGESAMLLYTPYANESRLRHALFSDQKERALTELLATRWSEQASKWCTEDRVNLLVAHLFLAGSDTEEEDQEGEKSIDHPGGVSRIPVGAIPSSVQYTALGHIHRGYNIGKEQPVVYSGSPLAYSVREGGNSNSVVVADIQPGQKATYRRVPLTKGYPIRVESFSSIAEAVDWMEGHQDCYVDITLSLKEYLSPEQASMLHDAHPRILDIHLAFEFEADEQGGAILARSDQNIYELFGEYFQSREGIEVPEQIMNLFKEIVGEDV